MIRETRFRVARCACMALSALIMLLSITSFILFSDAMHKFSYVTSLLGTNVFTYGVFIMITVSILSMMITPLLLYAVILQKSTLLTMLTFCTLSVGCLSILGSSLGFSLRTELQDETLQSWMVEGLKNEYGYVFHVTNAWDRVQSELECCGVESGTEWLTSDWFLGQTKFPRRRRPVACCRSCGSAFEKFCSSAHDKGFIVQKTCAKIALDCGSEMEKSVDSSVCTGQNLTAGGLIVDAFAHSQGCLPILSSRLYLYSLLMIGASLLMASFFFTQSLASFTLIYYSDPLLSQYETVHFQ